MVRPWTILIYKVGPEPIIMNGVMGPNYKWYSQWVTEAIRCYNATYRGYKLYLPVWMSIFLGMTPNHIFVCNLVVNRISLKWVNWWMELPAISKHFHLRLPSQDQTPTITQTRRCPASMTIKNTLRVSVEETKVVSCFVVVLLETGHLDTRWFFEMISPESEKL